MTVAQAIARPAGPSDDESASRLGRDLTLMEQTQHDPLMLYRHALSERDIELADALHTAFTRTLREIGSLPSTELEPILREVARTVVDRLGRG